MAELDEKLISEWRRTRDPLIVEVLRERLALEVRRASRRGDLEAAWARAVEQRNFQELLELLLCGTLRELEAKIRALGELDDPRVSLVLHRALVALGDELREPLVRAVIEVLGRSKDVSCRASLERWEEEEPEAASAALAQLDKVKVVLLPELGALVNPKPPREAELFEPCG